MFTVSYAVVHDFRDHKYVEYIYNIYQLLFNTSAQETPQKRKDLLLKVLFISQLLVCSILKM